MHKPKLLKEEERVKLRDELYEKYATSSDFSKRFLYYRKKYSWLMVIGAAKFFKRLLDVVVSFVLFIILTPLMLLISLIIKMDGGLILYVTNRVGKGGKEFLFPAFRIMSSEADKGKDPRLTLFGRVLHKTGLDQLPQLWCVFKGDMSLVGPKPPLPSEVASWKNYERDRLDITPGLTHMGEVRELSKIPLSTQVKLNRQYMESQSFWLDIKLLVKTIPAVILGRGAY